MIFERVFRNLHAVTMTGADGLGVLPDAAIAIADGRIAWIGPAAELPAGGARHRHDLGGAWVTPGLIDCHTHLVFAGSRVDEFVRRLEGASYEEIARAGGGILSTVAATRQASEEELFDAALARLADLQRAGVTTVEIKSGYGLDLETEMRMLRVARRLAAEEPVDVVTTFLGLHALPPEQRDDRRAYVELVAGPMLETIAAAGLADLADAFLEPLAFDAGEVRLFLGRARARGLGIRLHADQLSDSGGAALAAELGALSADHLEYAGEEGVRAMARAGTVAVLLPGAFYTLRQERRPPVELFRHHGVPMAVATDANPGSSPLLSPLVAMNMACVLFGLTPAEALRGTTAVAARALGLDDRGTLEAGKRADLAVWRVARPEELCYWLGADLLDMVVVEGEPLVAGAGRGARPGRPATLRPSLRAAVRGRAAVRRTR